MTTTPLRRQILAPLSVLCVGLIDYAGLFPPAEAPMDLAVANYAAYRRGADSWLNGQFILPITRLAEFEAAQAGVAGSDADATPMAPWRLSALVANQPERLAADLDQIVHFNARHSGSPPDSALGGDPATHGAQIAIGSIETKAQTADEIAGIAQTFAAWRGALPRLQVYVELPLNDETATLIGALAAAGLRAKVRTGGVTADAFPSPEALAAFLVACVEAGVRFKATAGLHHAIRATYRLTYAPDSASALMYGFLNVALAAAFLSAGAPLAATLDVLRETDAAAFRFDAMGVSWRERRLTTEQLAETRRTRIMGYGSCSFEEPVEHLRALGLV